MFDTKEKESLRASTSVLLGFGISKGVKGKSCFNGMVAASVNHSHCPPPFK